MQKEVVTMKKRTRLILWIAIFAGMAVVGPQARGGDAKTFKGEVADTQCALNVHSLSQSHKEMIEMRPEVKTNADCARFCVKERGGRFVLQTHDKVYKLDAQALAEHWAGRNVKIVGTLDPKTNVIAVRSIEALSANPDKAAHPK
jgi:Protein of unknown function (DUF5818)